MYKITLNFTAIKIRGSGKVEKLTETIVNDEIEAPAATIRAVQEITNLYPGHAITKLEICAELDFSAAPEVVS